MKGILLHHNYVFFSNGNHSRRSRSLYFMFAIDIVVLFVIFVSWNYEKKP